MRNVLTAVTASLAIVPIIASADPINTIDANATSCEMAPLNSFTAGPIADCNYTWTSTDLTSVYGWQGGYVLVSNGIWENFTHAGLNTDEGTMTFTFDSLVSSVLAFVNYAPEHGNSSIAIYDDNNNLLESLQLSISTPGGSNAGEDWGFSRASADIRSFTVSNAFVVATNLRTITTTVSVPEPGTLALLGLGLVGMAFGQRRKTV